MSKTIKQRRNIIVTYDLIANPSGFSVGTFNAFLYVPFKPDEVILRNVAIADDQLGASDLISVNSDLVDSYNDNFFSVPNLTISSSINTSFSMSQPINRTFTFNVKYLHSPNVVSALISFMLEFISYEARDDFNSPNNVRINNKQLL